jgi:hypothetical protein
VIKDDRWWYSGLHARSLSLPHATGSWPQQQRAAWESAQFTRSSTRLVSAPYGLFTAMQMRCGGMGARERARGLAGEGANVAKEDENSDWQQRQRSDVPVAKELDAPEAG